MCMCTCAHVPVCVCVCVCVCACVCVRVFLLATPDDSIDEYSDCNNSHSYSRDPVFVLTSVAEQLTTHSMAI